MTVTEAAPSAASLGYGMYDADQHYYEAEDAFTRHLDREFRNAIRWIDLNGRRTLLVNDRLLKLIPNPTYDPVGRPGAMVEYFRGNNQAGRSPKEIMGELQAIQPEYRDRAARVKALDELGVEFTWVLPSLGLGIEEMLKDDPAALHAAFTAYNRWVDEDWGFNRDGRLQTGALMTLVDPEAAEAELARVLAAGARMLVFRPAPVVGPYQSWSPGDPRYDRFWSMVEEAGAVVAYHAADSGYHRFAESWGEGAQFQGLKGASPFDEILSLHIERPISETISALIAHGVFDRHPKLKVATVELGSGWVRDLFRRMRSAYGKIPQQFAQDPTESFREHVWVTPFYEDSVPELVDLIGPDRVIFGSDWPHPEGLARPTEFAEDVADLPAEQQRLVLRDNLRRLVGHG